MIYVSADSKRMLEQIKANKNVQIAYDPEDVSCIYLIEGMEYHTFQLSESYRRYAGATEEEYRLEQERWRPSRREAEQKDTEGRLRLFKDIKNIIDQAECIEKDTISQEVVKRNRGRELA